MHLQQMLRSIGKRPKKAGDLVDLLLECHARIRYFCALACAAGEQAQTSDRERAEACASVERYLRDALPLHVADEEDSLVPRLRGSSASVDAALEAMRAQHAAHSPKLHTLLAHLAEVRARPDDGAQRALLAAAARDLEREFAQHLALEEEALFPAVRQLSASEQAAVVAELRARRGASPAFPH